MTKILHLSLKRKWYRMYENGEKDEDYREMTPYWYKRLAFRKYDYVHFTLGYPSKDDPTRNMIRKFECTIIGTGKPELGAEPNKLYYIIKTTKNNNYGKF